MGCIIEERDRRDMVHAGKYVAEREFRGHASFHLNQLYSLIAPIQALFDLYQDVDSMGFYNNFLAVPWSRKASEPIEPDTLAHLLYEGIPDVFLNPSAITCGVDVQGDRIEYQVVCWVGDTPFVAVHEQIERPISELQVWITLVALLIGWNPDKIYVDGRFRYDYVKEGLEQACPSWVEHQVIEITKGYSSRSGSFGMPIVGSRRGGYTLISPDEAKMRILVDMLPRAPMINRQRVPADFLFQLTAEHLETVPMRNGDEHLSWKPHRERNEALDCFVLNLAAKMALGPNYRRVVIDYDALFKRLDESP